MNKQEFVNKFVNQIICGDWIKELKKLPTGIFHCCITSPPYWGQRDYGCDGQLGLEKTPELHIEKLVEGFREVRRVLRDDGVLFLNYGDKYAGDEKFGGKSGSKNYTSSAGGYNRKREYSNLSQGNLLMLPVRVTLALQADGWILRDDIIWAKAISFCDKYSGSCMPESVSGTRWERHRIKVKKGTRNQTKGGNRDRQLSSNPNEPTISKADQAKWVDCPGCEKCGPNGGLILRKGSWRCTKAHEHIFQLVKTNNYFCDMEAVKEDLFTPEEFRGKEGWGPSNPNHRTPTGIHGPSLRGEGRCGENNNGRNLRNVWAINPRGYSDAHYATFPEDLVEPMIKVATSQRGVCPKCGAQWARIVESNRTFQSGSGKSGIMPNGKYGPNLQGGGETLDIRRGPCVETITLGFKATCDCGIEETVPALILDPFMGSGTVAVKAIELNRNYTGIDVNPNYCKEHAQVRCRAAEYGMSPEEVKAGQKVLFE